MTVGRESSPESMDNVFAALAHRHRRQILDLVKASPGCTVGEVAKQFDVTRIAVMKHLAVLEKAGLVVTQKVGRSRHLYLNAVPIQMIYERWTTEFSSLWASRLTGLKYRLEAAVDTNDESRQKEDAS